MKKQILYIICIILSIVATAKVGYMFVNDVKELFVAPASTERIIIEVFTSFLAVVGWCFITHKVFKREYKWLKKENGRV